jgi:WD40 repeat protein
MDSGTGTSESGYDLFLSYNSVDHSFVENIARKLRDEGLRPFLDRWNLLIGTRWRPMLEKALSSSKAVAIFVGPGEMGSWQQREVDIALDLQSKSANLPVIPVLLPGSEPPLGFLRQLTWVDLRTQAFDRGLVILAKAARGEVPGPEIQKDSDSVRASICPYRGLLHFREEDAPFFFGREAAIDKLLEAVQRQPFVAVVGASGSGKSSVVRAGLVPRLRRDRRTAWETVILVPSAEPLKALAKALVPLWEPTLNRLQQLARAKELAAHFRSGTISLYDIVEDILEKESGTDRVLIVVDQFEELYTLTSDEEACRRFLDELLAASSHAESKANIALALRGDFVGKALANRSLSDQLQDAQVNLGPMTRQELECAICKPAEKVQLEFESGLVRRILNDVGNEPGNLPLLEFVLRELWDKRHGGILLNETYDVIGGVQGAVATKADELLKGLSLAEQKTLQRVFLRIVRPSESGLDTRRRAAFSELPPDGAEIVVKLAKERLLVTNRSPSDREQTVEVAHEALISNWSTLRAWVNEDREFLLWRERLGSLLAEWERAQESDETLLRGPLLIEAQKWFHQRSQDLSDQERKFISASRQEREQLARQEKERQEREIEAARKLAEEQKERAELFERREEERKEAARKLRRRAFAAAAAATMALILLATTFFNWLKVREQAQEASQSDCLVAEEDWRLGQKAEALAHFAMAQHHMPKSSFLEEALANALSSLPKSSFLEEALANALSSLPKQNARVSFKGHGDAVLGAVFSRNGQRVLTASGDRTARLWDTDSGKQLANFEGHTGVVRSAVFSPNGRLVLTASDDRTARLWDTDSGKQLASFEGHTGVVRSAVFSPNGQRVLTASDDRTARLWDTDSGKQLAKFEGHTEALLSAVFSPDGRRVLTTSYDETARLWDTDGRKQLASFEAHNGAVRSAVFSSDGQRVLTASSDKAQLWDADSGKQLISFAGHADTVWSAVFSPDGRRVLTASGDKTARLWDVDTGRQLGSFEGHAGAILNALFSPDGQRVLTTSWDNTARLWDTNSRELLTSFEGHADTILSAVFSPDGRWVLTASRDQTARLWEAVSARLMASFEGYSGAVWSAVFSPDGRRVLTASDDRTARLWDTDSGELLTSFSGHGDGVWSAVFSPDGRRVLTASSDKSARLWNADSGKLLHSFEDPTVVRSAVFSPDGRRVLTASYDNTARLWEAESGKPLFTFQGHQKAVNSAVFSPDSRWVLTASSDNTAWLWDTNSGKCLVRFQGHKEAVNSAVFSPDGRWVLTASSDNTAWLWDTNSGKSLVKFVGHTKMVHSAVFSPDGRQVLTASGDGTVRLWDTKSGSQLASFEGHTKAVLSAVFSPDGRRMLTASADGTVRLWPLLPANALPPNWCGDFLVWLGGKQIARNGQTEPLSGDELRELEVQLHPHENEDSDCARLLRRTLSPAEKRPVDPYGSTTQVQAADLIIRPGMSREEAWHAYKLDPCHPLIHLALAGFEGDPVRADFLRKYSLDRLPKNPKFRQSATQFLRNQGKDNMARQLEGSATE